MCETVQKKQLDDDSNRYVDLVPFICGGGCCETHPHIFSSHSALRNTLHGIVATLGLNHAIFQEHIDETIRIIHAAACIEERGEKPKKGSHSNK